MSWPNFHLDTLRPDAGINMGLLILASMNFAKHGPLGSGRRKETLRLHLAERRRSPTYGGRVVTGIVSVFLAVIVWIAFGRALGHEFVGYDDQRYVVQNA